MAPEGTADERAVGVLALQGDFDAHRRALADCGAGTRTVRLAQDLEGLRGLVLPGGESTTLLRLMEEYGFDGALPPFVEGGGALYGTCAGAILLARRVLSPPQPSLNLLDVAVERNAYGRQIDSFEDDLTDVAPEVLQIGSDASATRSEDGIAPPLPAVFIRAPRITEVGPRAVVLASRDGEPVLVRQGRILVSTFHPELTPDRRVHRYFLERIVQAR